jgi:predicted ATPase
MTEQLRATYEQAQHLPDEVQNELAARIAELLEEIEEQEWDAIVSQPHVLEKLREFGKEAREEHQRGETLEGGFGDE